MDPIEQNTPPAEPVNDTPPADIAEGAAAAIGEALATESTPEPQKTEDVPGEKPAAPVAVEPAKPEAVKTTDDEIAELGLKQKAADRFRELTPYKAAFKEAGIEKLEDLPRIVERAKFADELEQAIVETGTTPEQYGQAIQYLALVNSGQPAMLEKAYEVMQAELATLAKALGKEAPGVHDPLAEHEDLREEVAAGDLTRKRALEIAAQRATGSLTQAQATQAREQAEQKAVFDRAIGDLNALGAQLKAGDPFYASKIAALQPTIALIRERCPPSEWAARVDAAYKQVVVAAPAPAPAPTLPPPGPVRSVVPAGVNYAAEAKSPEEAISAALAAMGGVR